MPFAVFVLSTGRCGTQWLAEQLGSSYGETFRVEHEPLHNGYRPRRMLGTPAPLNFDPEDARPILAHIEEIEGCLERSSYIECGHPCWSAIPYLANRFPGRMRVVHLTRHPIPTSLSWLTHGAYQPPILPHVPEKVLLSPFDAGIRLEAYRERWTGLHPFEKCLYYWAEVNVFGLIQQERLGVPWLRLSYEALFQADGLDSLLSFLGLPHRESIFAARTRPVDRFQYMTPMWPDLRVVEQHPHVVEVANLLGYDMTDIVVEALYRRYLGLSLREGEA
jgi:hypothetical protein